MRSSTDTEVGVYEDAGDRVSVKEKEKSAKAREAKRLNGLREIMASSNGRLWMWQFLSSCGLFSVVFNGNSRDYFNLGARSAGMPVMAEIQKNCLEEYILMAKENTNV